MSTKQKKVLRLWRDILKQLITLLQSNCFSLSLGLTVGSNEQIALKEQLNIIFTKTILKAFVTVLNINNFPQPVNNLNFSYITEGEKNINAHN